MALELLLRRPIWQAPMAGAHGSSLAVAVSSAASGKSLGAVACALVDADAARRELRAARERLGLGALPAVGRGRGPQTQPLLLPVNVNFFSSVGDVPTHAGHVAAVEVEVEERVEGWRRKLEPWAASVGNGQVRIPTAKEALSAPARRAFDEEAVEVVEEAKPLVVSFHFGLPANEALLERVRRVGSIIACSATTVEEAVELERRGVDVVIAQGWEAGGHRGSFLPTTRMDAQLGTFALVQQVVRAVQVPVIAAGGIGDARGVRAAMALGASGVQVGSAFLLCPECTGVSEAHRAGLRDAALASRTVVTNAFTGRPARAILNRFVESMGVLAPNPPPFAVASTLVGPTRSAAEKALRLDVAQMWCGQNAFQSVRSVPAADVVAELVRGLSPSPSSSSPSSSSRL